MVNLQKNNQSLTDAINLGQAFGQSPMGSIGLVNLDL
jgi:hypothetical protein